MADTPSFDEVLKNALDGIDSDDVRIFYGYLDDLKRKAARSLTHKARQMPGASNVAASALFSLLCDVAVLDIPLNDVDNKTGLPALWPLLLQYVERHCRKWNEWHNAKMRKGVEVSLHGAADVNRTIDDVDRTIDPEDHRASVDDAERYDEVVQRLIERLTEEEQQVLKAKLAGKSLAEIATLIGRSEKTVSNRLAHIREVLQTL
jgi:RNA polymerase sigma factor (sigma-70 family)